MHFSDSEGDYAVFALDEVPIKATTSNKSKTVFTVKNEGAECSVLFPVKNKKGTPIRYFIEYDSETLGRTVRGYVKPSDINVVDEQFEMPTLSYIDRDRVYGRHSKRSDAYAVYCIQCVLFSHGYLDSIADCDGIYGARTATAVLSFQETYNMDLGDLSSDFLDEDGIWGPKTWNAMYETYGY